MLKVQSRYTYSTSIVVFAIVISIVSLISIISLLLFILRAQTDFYLRKVNKQEINGDNEYEIVLLRFFESDCANGGRNYERRKYSDAAEMGKQGK